MNHGLTKLARNVAEVHQKGAVGWCCGLMVSGLVSGLSGPGLSPGQYHCVVFLGETC